MKVAEYEEVPKKLRGLSSDKEDNLLANLDFENEKEGQIQQLNKKMVELEDEIKKRQGLLNDRDGSIEKLNRKIADL